MKHKMITFLMASVLTATLAAGCHDATETMPSQNARSKQESITQSEVLPNTYPSKSNAWGQGLSFSESQPTSREAAPSQKQIPSFVKSERTASEQEDNVHTIQVTAGTKTFSATMAETAAAEAFAELMNHAPIVINMSDYSGFEKVGPLGTSLPTSDREITAQAGDIMLYSGNQIVVFYGSNAWSYTRIGTINDLSGWEEALGTGDMTITFSIP